MSATDKPEQANPRQAPVENPLTMKDLGTMLIKHYDLHEGKFDLWLEFQVGFGNVGPNQESVLPGAALGISRVGLVSSKTEGPFTIDAATVNPARRRRAARTADASASGTGSK